jgi:hypothetical protein
MSETKTSIRARKSVVRRKRGEVKALMRNRLLELLVSGISHNMIARELGLNVASVRRQIAGALEARPVETPRQYVALQTARLEKAIMIADQVMERGDVRAIGPLLKTLAQLDRYHGLALRLASARPDETKRATLSTPMRTLTTAAKRAQSDTQALEIACPLTDMRETSNATTGEGEPT